MAAVQSKFAIVDETKSKEGEVEETRCGRCNELIRPITDNELQSACKKNYLHTTCSCFLDSSIFATNKEMTKIWRKFVSEQVDEFYDYMCCIRSACTTILPDSGHKYIEKVLNKPCAQCSLHQEMGTCNIQCCPPAKFPQCLAEMVKLLNSRSEGFRVLTHEQLTELNRLMSEGKRVVIRKDPPVHDEPDE